MSTLSAFPFIGEQSFATPGAFNSPLSIISANIAAINTDVGAISGVTISPPSGNTIQMPSDLSISGYLSVGKGVSIGTQAPSIAKPVALTIGVNSGISDYLYFNDTSNLRSDYLVGSHAGGTADGLNIFDVSGNTLIVGFSKQSVRFYVPVVASAFDTGSRVYDLRAYGGDPTGVVASDGAFAAAKTAAPAGVGTTFYLSTGTWKFATTIDLTSEPSATYNLLGDGPQLTLVLSSTSTTPAVLASSTSNAYNSIRGLTLFHADQAFPSRRTGNYAIKNFQAVSHALIVDDVQIRYFGDSGIYIEGSTANVILRNIEVQSCPGYGIELAPFNGQSPQDVQIIAGDIQFTWGGIRLNGGISATVLDQDIELGIYAHYPCVELLGNANGNTFINCSLSQQTTSTTTPQGIVSLINAKGNTFIGGLNTTNSTGSADNIYLDVGASSNHFVSGQYSNTTTASGYLVNLIQSGNVPIDNTFETLYVVPNTYQSGKQRINGGAANNSTVFGQIAYGADSSASTFAGLFQHLSNPAVYIGGAAAVGSDAGRIMLGSNVERPARAATITAYVPANATGTDFVGARFIINQGGATPIEVLRLTPDTQSLFTAGSVLLPALGFSSESSLGLYRSAASTVALSYGTLRVPELWATSGLSVGNATAGGTLIPAISSTSSLVAAFVVQGSASSFTRIVWAAAQPGDHILVTPGPTATVSSISSGLVAHSHCTQAGQIEFRLSNVSTLAQNQSTRTWYFTRISPF